MMNRESSCNGVRMIANLNTEVFQRLSNLFSSAAYINFNTISCGFQSNKYSGTVRGVEKFQQYVTSIFFNTTYLLPKDLRFEHGGANLASCPGQHLTSLRPWGSLMRIDGVYSFGQNSSIRTCHPTPIKASEGDSALLRTREKMRFENIEDHNQ